MGRRRRGRRSRRGHAQPTADLARPAPSHPLGEYGVDWNDEFACIAGFTPGGAPYGVPWREATWLKDDPEFADLVAEYLEPADWQDESRTESRPGDLDRDIPF